MRVLMVADFYPPLLGGVEMMVSTLSAELVTRGHDVSVATLQLPGLPAHEDIAGVHVHRLRSTTSRASSLFSSDERPWAPPVPDPHASVALRALVRRQRPDVVHGHDWLARSFLPLKRRGGPPFVMSLHYFTLSCPKKNLMYDGVQCSGPAPAKCVRCASRHYGRVKGTTVAIGQKLGGRTEARLVDRFMPVSEATAHDNQLPERNLPYTVVRNFVPPARSADEYAELLRSLPGEPFLLFVGDIRRDKGADVLVAAYEDMADAPPLVLIGKTWPESPRTLPSGVHVLGEWPNAAVREAMRRCIALVVPSTIREPGSIVVAEALTAGRPVVASSTGGIPEVARPDQDGLLVPPGDVRSLRRALERIVTDVDLRERLAANARVRAAEFTPARIVPQFEAVYERVVADRRSMRS